MLSPAALFGMYLSPKSVGNAELTIGATDSSKYTGDLVYSPMSQSGEGNWVLDSSAVYVNGQTTDTLSQVRNIIFDSGTPNVYFSSKETVEVRVLPEY